MKKTIMLVLTVLMAASLGTSMNGAAASTKIWVKKVTVINTVRLSMESPNSLPKRTKRSGRNVLATDCERYARQQAASV